MNLMARTVALAGTIATLLAVPGLASAQGLTGSAMVNALKKGGYVIVLRHASSPREAPDEKTANADNVTRERQLDTAGRADATALGKALRELAIPIGTVLSSPTYRALETARFAQLPNPQVAAELGDRGQSMQGVSDADGAWLRSKVVPSSTATNTMLITHLPNITQAFPQYASGIADGDALVFSADGKGGATLVGVIKIAEWPAFRR